MRERMRKLVNSTRPLALVASLVYKTEDIEIAENHYQPVTSRGYLALNKYSGRK